jgi:hypothetical protein
MHPSTWRFVELSSSQVPVGQSQVLVGWLGQLCCPSLLGLTDLQDLSGSICFPDLSDPSCNCLAFRPMELPLAARKDLDRTKFAAEL